MVILLHVLLFVVTAVHEKKSEICELLTRIINKYFQENNVTRRRKKPANPNKTFFLNVIDTIYEKNNFILSQEWKIKEFGLR